MNNINSKIIYMEVQKAKKNLLITLLMIINKKIINNITQRTINTMIKMRIMIILVMINGTMINNKVKMINRAVDRMKIVPSISFVLKNNVLTDANL